VRSGYLPGFAIALAESDTIRISLLWLVRLADAGGRAGARVKGKGDSLCVIADRSEESRLSLREGSTLAPEGRVRAASVALISIIEATVMNRVLLKLTIAIVIGSLLFSTPTRAQQPPAKSPPHPEITKGPELELNRSNWAIIRWTSSNPRGTEEHWGVVHYGTDPQNLSQKAISHIRLNPSHPDTIFRVRMMGLNPRTTYYYTVDSMQVNGKSDGVKSPVNHFTTPD